MSMKRVCICTIFGAEETYIFSSSLPMCPSSSLSSQYRFWFSCCSSFFRLKAMCHSLLLSLCLFLHLFLLLPPTQSLSPLPTPFSLVTLDAIVSELLTACVSLCICSWCFFNAGVPIYLLCQPFWGLLLQPLHGSGSGRAQNT